MDDIYNDTHPSRKTKAQLLVKPQDLDSIDHVTFTKCKVTLASGNFTLSHYPLTQGEAMCYKTNLA